MSQILILYFQVLPEITVDLTQIKIVWKILKSFPKFKIID